ncbi:MAG: TolC family protein [Bacteroidales bacterium]|jgi:outer membrane protein TolC|nr:TolC family protein [Bacteroidales bacterium]
MRKLLLSLLLILNIVVSAFGQKDSTMNLSLKQAREYAFEHNYDLINAKLDIYKAKKRVWETTAIGLPQVNTEFSHNYSIKIGSQVIEANGQTSTFKFGKTNSTKIDLTVSQLIFSGDYIVGLRTSKIYKSLSETQKNKTKSDIIQNINDAYYSVLVAKENIGILNNSIDNTKKLLSETELMVKAGVADDISYDQLQVTVMTLENSLSSLKRQESIAKYLLKIQMGLDIDNKIILTDSLNYFTNDLDVNQEISYKFTPENQPDYMLAKVQEDLQRQNVNLHKVAFLPTISAFYNNQSNLVEDKFEVFNSSSKWLPSSMVGVSIKLPLFTSGSRLAKLSQARVDYKKAQNTREKVSQSLRMAVIQAQKDLLTANETLIKDKLNRKLTKKIYDQSTVKFQEGVISSTELTQNQNQYFQSLNQYYQSVFNLLTAKNKLNRLLNNYEKQ